MEMKGTDNQHSERRIRCQEEAPADANAFLHGGPRSPIIEAFTSFAECSSKVAHVVRMSHMPVSICECGAGRRWPAELPALRPGAAGGARARSGRASAAGCPHRRTER